jgi:hypothetical protein
VLPCVPWLGTLTPAAEGSGTATCPAALNRSWIKKGLDIMDEQHGSHLPKVHLHVTEATTRRAGKWRYFDLQNEHTRGYNIML